MRAATRREHWRTLKMRRRLELCWRGGMDRILDPDAPGGRYRNDRMITQSLNDWRMTERFPAAYAVRRMFHGEQFA